MRLSSVQLRSIADNLDSLAKIHAKVREVEYDNLVLLIEHFSDQKEGDSYYLIGIEEIEK